jgi:hypothetical protein
MYEDYPAEVAQAGALVNQTLVNAKMIKVRTKMERLHDLKKGLETKLEEVNNAISLLEKNPEFLQVIDALEKIGHI